MDIEQPAWIEWQGGVCPVAPGTDCEVRFEDGEVERDYGPEGWNWGDVGVRSITHYRVWSAEPTWQAQALADIPELTPDQTSAIKYLAGGRNQMGGPA